MTALLLVLWLLVAVVVLGFLFTFALLVFGLVQLAREAQAETKPKGAIE